MTSTKRPKTRIIVIISLILIGLWLALHVLLRTPPSQPLRIIGHRGAAGLAPENTLVSIQTALDLGVDAVEIDVHRSADGVLVVMHDASVQRTTDGTGKIGELTWDELSGLDAGSYFSSEFAGEPVPRLDDVLEMVKSSNGTLYLEVKEPYRYPGIEDQIIEMLNDHEMESDTVVMSFDHRWLAEFRALAPEIRVFSLEVGVFRPPLDGAESAVGVQWRSVILDPTLIWRMHRQGIKVSVWTVNHRWQMRLLTWLGVDAITTDRPDLWVDLE